MEVTDGGLVVEQDGVRKTIEVRWANCLVAATYIPSLIFVSLFYCVTRSVCMFCACVCLLSCVQCDTVVICAGQEPRRVLHDALMAVKSGRPKLFMIGGAHEAGELDAKRAIDQGTRCDTLICLIQIINK